jgi:hypothetical protein
MDDARGVNLQNLSYHLGGEAFTFNTGNLQQVVPGRLKATETRPNRAFNARGERCPVQLGLLNPAASLIFYQITSFLHPAQQFKGK